MPATFMPSDRTTRRSHDVAYACFLPPGIFGLVSGVASLIPMDTGTAGGIGFLILVPLAIASLVSVPMGIFRTAFFWRDSALLLLAVATVVMLVQMFVEVGPVGFRNVLWVVYGALVITIEVVWFVARRRRVYER